MKLTLEKIIKIYFKENTGFRGLINKLFRK
jgi:hypothetical protein